MSLCLLVDTTLSGIILGLSDLNSSQLIGYEMDSNSFAGSKSLASKFKLLIDTYKVAPSDIENVCVSTGPGSFTGIKVGLAYVYGLMRGMPSKISATGVSSLALFAKDIATSEGDAAVFLPATKVRGALALTSDQSDVAISDIDVVVDGFNDVALNRKIILLKPWQSLEDKLSGLGLNYHIYDTDVVATKVMRAMSDEAACAYRGEKFRKSLPAPFYLRKSAAEEKLVQRGV